MQVPGINGALVSIDTASPVYSFSANRYFSGLSGNRWFTCGSTRSDLAGWMAKTGETGAVAQKIDYPDPERTLEKYNAVMGGDGAWSSFIAEVRKQPRYNWRPSYTAPAINKWIREGFGRNAGPVRPKPVRNILKMSGPEKRVEF